MAATSTTIHRSSDGGQNWMRATISDSFAVPIQGLAAGPGVLVASATRWVNSTGKPVLLVSTDGLHWTATAETPSLPASTVLVYADRAFHSITRSTGNLWRSGALPTLTAGYESWRARIFGEAPSSEPQADPDGDGASNLAEYFAGTDPLSATTRPEFATKLTAGSLSLAVPRSPDVTDVHVRFETSIDLSNWTDVGVTVSELPAAIVGTVELDSPRRFLRARLELLK